MMGYKYYKVAVRCINVKGKNSRNISPLFTVEQLIQQLDMLNNRMSSAQMGVFSRFTYIGEYNFKIQYPP